MCWVVLSGAVVLLAACGGGGTDQATVVLEGEGGPTTVAVEVADTAAERRQGLRGREELEPGSGMVFLFGEPVGTQFVMEDTLIPLSIAFVDETGRIIAIRTWSRAAPSPVRPMAPSARSRPLSR